MTPTNNQVAQPEDVRSVCKLCMRKSPNYCKRHAPRASVTETSCYSQKQLDEAIAQRERSVRKEIVKEIIRYQNKFVQDDGAGEGNYLFWPEFDVIGELLKSLQNEQKGTHE